MSELGIETFVANTDTIDFCLLLNQLDPLAELNCGLDSEGSRVVDYSVVISPYPEEEARDISQTIFDQYSSFSLSEETQYLDLTQFQD